MYGSPNNPQDKPENGLYYITIIEIAFMIYHLMSIFRDNDDPEN